MRREKGSRARAYEYRVAAYLGPEKQVAELKRLMQQLCKRALKLQPNYT